jgi:hypothetical protein
MGLLDKLFGAKETVDAAGQVIDKVANTVDRFVLTKQEKQEFQMRQEEMEWRFKTLEEENFQKEEDRVLKKYELDGVDRQGARQHNQAEIANSDSFVRRFRYIFAGMITVILFSLFAFIIFGTIPKGNARYVDFLIGQLSTILITIIGFYFGSSQGAAMKDQTINDLTTKANKL